MSKSIEFHATRNDLIGLLTDLESVRSICYIESGVFDEPKTIIYPSASQISDLGKISVLESAQGRCLLLADTNTRFKLRTIRPRIGAVRYAVDQYKNIDTISVEPGGQFDSLVNLAGSFGTCTNSLISFSLMKLVGSLVKKKWTRIKSYAVGPEAERILDMGGRLTFSLQAPREYDLTR